MIDCHNHTNFSYCSEPTLTLQNYIQVLENNKALKKICITDHGMSIYFPKDIALKWEYIENPEILDFYLNTGDYKLTKYIESFRNITNPNIICGLEVEMSNNGKLIYNDKYRKYLFPIIGSVHFLTKSKYTGTSDDEILKFWYNHNMLLLEQDIDILGHPFRWISTQVEYIPDKLVKDILLKAKETDIAIEINSHHMNNKLITLDFLVLREALYNEIKIAFGTDSHHETQIGNLSYHKWLLEKSGISKKDLNFFAI